MNTNHYFTNEELEAQIQRWAEAYPRLLQVNEIGKSHEGRPLWLLTLTNQDSGLAEEKPGIWIDANIHALELAGTTTALRIAEQLLEGFEEDERATRLLNTSVYYILPRVNPDGASRALAEHPQYLRSGVRPYPFMEREEGLHVQDVDGDGRILMMRIPDPTGDWKVSSLDARLMEKRAPHEYGGQYYRVFREGLLEEYDGYIIKTARPYQGLDFNRNFPYNWRPEGDQMGSGPYPASEPEIRTMVDFISQRPNINLALTYHTFSAAILRPFSTRPDDDMEVEDLWTFQMMGDLGTEITGYRSASVFHDFRYHPKEVITGAFDDWVFDHFGIYSFTIELWDLPTEAGIKDRKWMEWFRSHPHEEDLKILQWIDNHAPPGSYVAWYPYDHPQLGKVELGGWNTLYTWINPPIDRMGAEAERNVPYALALGDLLPHLSIHTLELSPLESEGSSSGAYSLRLVVENSGFLPTYTSSQGKNRSAARPVRIELDLPEGTVLTSGRRRVEVGHLEGRSNKHTISPLWAESSTDNRARLDWTISGPKGARVTIKVLSDRAGSITRQIELA
jgi:murein tripeptide amidase MpaA